MNSSDEAVFVPDLHYSLPVDHKFACVALENVGIDRALRDPIDLGNGMWLLFEPPFPLDDHWRSWLGSIRAENLERTNLTLFLHAPSAAPGVLDGENEQLRQSVLRICYGLFLIDVFHHDGGLIMSGANVDGAISIRQVAQLEPLYRPSRVRIARLDRTSLLNAARVADGMGIVHSGSGHHERLRKGFHAWLRGMMEYYGDERLHQFIRAVEAVVKPPKGRGTKMFAHRCQLFAGNSAQGVSVLRELYELRNTAEHHNSLGAVLPSCSGAALDRMTLRRAYQAQVLAIDVYRQIFLDPQLQQHFAEDATIDAFWNLPLPQQIQAWGATLDLEAIATARMLP